MKSNLICTRCPYGCRLDVEHDESRIVQISGNRCNRGLEYARQELFDPRRIVTTTVYISGAPITLVPVKTNRSVPKRLMFDIVKTASRIHVQAPVRLGDVIVQDICGSGADLVVTRTIVQIHL